jgi:hypothetical protein
MEPPRFLALFNQPDPKIPTGHRDMTNTPAQSLALLNDPFVQEMARQWATTVAARTDDTVPGRLARMFQAAFSRPPTDAEQSRWTDALHDLAELHEIPEESILANYVIWQDVAHALFNTKEFLYLQ